MTLMCQVELPVKKRAIDKVVSLPPPPLWPVFENLEPLGSICETILCFYKVTVFWELKVKTA